jgi:hypothetical protein
MFFTCSSLAGPLPPVQAYQRSSDSDITSRRYQASGAVALGDLEHSSVISRLDVGRRPPLPNTWISGRANPPEELYELVARPDYNRSLRATARSGRPGPHDKRRYYGVWTACGFPCVDCAGIRGFGPILVVVGCFDANTAIKLNGFLPTLTNVCCTPAGTFAT